MKVLIAFLFIVLPFAGNTQSKQNLVVNFDFDKYEITRESKLKLDSFLRSSTIASIQKIDLYGHCDLIGDNTYNDWLSLKRVDAVKEYLAGNDLPGNIFETIKGFGKRKPLNQNRDDAERSLNRRVEINIERRPEEKSVAPVGDTLQIQNRSLTEKIKDTTLKAGTNIILKNLNFVGGRHWLVPQSKTALEELLQVMQQFPTLEIEIQGHICCESGPGDGVDFDTQTRNLSVNRAKAIYDYLVSNNIDARRISYKGFGHQFPLYPEDSEEHQLLNRRVEIKIIRR